MKLQSESGMGTEQRNSSESHLFSLRLWAEEIDRDQFEWRGQIRAVASGEIHYFRDADSLYGVLMSMLADADMKL